MILINHQRDSRKYYLRYLRLFVIKVFVIFFQQTIHRLLDKLLAGIEESTLDPVRIVYLVVHLTGVIILAAYSAALISFLATQTVYLPFSTMDGLLQDGTYRFAVVGDSSDYSFFQVKQ